MPRDLNVVQRWFQAVITHPEGVESGRCDTEAGQLIPEGKQRLEAVIHPSSRLDAAARLSVYAHAYYARLMECLADGFPTLRRALGEEVFDDFAFAYLQAFPSRSDTLDRLGDDFPVFLASNRPREREDGTLLAEVDWPEFLIDLAHFDLAIAEVFDGPGVESKTIVTPEDLAQLNPEQWSSARLETVCCLRLLHARWPVNAYRSAMRAAAEDQAIAPPVAPEEEYVALTRRDFIVRRIPLEAPGYVLLQALQAQATVGQAIEIAAQSTSWTDEQLSVALRRWFAVWASEGLFARVIFA